MALATLTKTGRAIALAISSRPLHLAWGSGDPAWDADGATLPSLIGSTALLNEAGPPDPIGFVEPTGRAASSSPWPPAPGARCRARYRLATEPTPPTSMCRRLMPTATPPTRSSGNGLFMDTELKVETRASATSRPPTSKAPGLLLARRRSSCRASTAALRPPDRRVRPADLGPFPPRHRFGPPLRYQPAAALPPSEPFQGPGLSTVPTAASRRLSCPTCPTAITTTSTHRKVRKSSTATATRCKAPG